MSYDPTTGIYTPPTGAENATPSQVIRSATWNSIWTDVSSALTSLGQQAWVKNPKIVASGSFTVGVGDALILVQGNSPTITLPAAATKQGPVRIAGAATTVFGSVNAVVVVAGGELINGLASFTLNSNFQSVILQPLSAANYLKW